MSALEAHLQRLIASHGPLTLARFMTEALTHPRLGYYMGQDPLGAAGDFTTAPEISQMFGELIGLWAAVLWRSMGAPAPVMLVELGPGRGTLMADALRAAAGVDGFRRALSVHLVDISPNLRARQAAALADVEPVFHASLAELPEAPMILIANEFVDALPIHQFERTPDGWRERLIGCQAETGALGFALAPQAGPAAALIPETLAEAPVGSVAETCPQALSLAAEIGRRVIEHGGGGLIVDYGGAQPSGQPSLQAVREHKCVAVLDRPGSADLSAHVDFAGFGAAAREAGAAVHGPVSQARLLSALGIEARAEALARAARTRAQKDAIQSGLARLIDASEMGTLFQALAVCEPRLGTPAGFEGA